MSHNQGIPHDDCCPSCRLGADCEATCEANPRLLARLLLRVTTQTSKVIEAKRHVVTLAAGAAADTRIILETSEHDGWRPVIEQWWYTTGGGQPAATPQTLEFGFVNRQIDLASVPTPENTNEKALVVPIAPYRSATGGCVLIPREIESDQWWRIFVRLGREGAAASRFECQISWVPSRYNFSEGWLSAGRVPV